MCVAVYEILIALEPALPEEEIQKHVRSTQYQFLVFKNVGCFMLLRRRYLDKAVTLLFRNSTVQRYKGNVAVACSKTPTLRPAVAAFDILSVLMLSTCGAKGSDMTAKQTP